MNNHSITTILAQPGIVPVPGIYDGLSLKLVERTGFQVAFLSGAGLSLARYGRPDLGFVGLGELADSVAAMTETVNIPLIVDIDTGFGNALSVTRTVEKLERAGASALQMEDQQAPKRCGHLSGKSLISQDEMVGKIKAAVETRKSQETLIFARTDAIAVTGLKDALTRAEAYLEAGADALFIEAPKTLEDMKNISKIFATRTPLIHNFVEGGKSPISSQDALADMGYKIALYPLAFLHAAIPAGLSMLEHLRKTGNTENWSGDHADLNDLNAYTDLQDWLDKSDTYS